MPDLWGSAMTTRTITVEALDADRLTAIIESRMSQRLAFLDDDGKTVTMLNPEQTAWALAHLYQTGDVVSGLPALPAEPDPIAGYMVNGTGVANGGNALPAERTLNEHGRVTCDACRSSTLPENWGNHLLGVAHQRNARRFGGSTTVSDGTALAAEPAGATGLREALLLLRRVLPTIPISDPFGLRAAISDFTGMTDRTRLAATPVGEGEG